MENTLLSIYVIIEEGRGSKRERQGKTESRNKSKKEKTVRRKLHRGLHGEWEM